MDRISVIIPCYNQAQYLRFAINSVLDQTRAADEIIVVDDGSTDSTAQVVADFQDSIHYIWQINQGPSAARNTAIRHAKGDYVAFLDSDDEWAANFLEEMMSLAQTHPASAVYYARARCMDGAGRELPQLTGAKLLPSGSMYVSLLDLNFLIPSTMLIRRIALENVGGFDPAMPRCEDWELFLRLAREYEFTGTLRCLARYRLHDNSLSVDVEQMQAAARAMFEKHFGIESEALEQWSDHKRLAFGGLYRYEALTHVIRHGDWQSAAQALRRGLQLRPTLSKDIDLYYELALGNQPMGVRGLANDLDLKQNALYVETLLNEVFASQNGSDLARLKPITYSTAYYALGLVAYNTGQRKLGRYYFRRAVTYTPQMAFDGKFVSLYIKSFLSPMWLKNFKQLTRYNLDLSHQFTDLESKQ